MEPTRIPASLNEESVFISASEIKLSPRQLVILLLAGGGWFVVSAFFSSLLHINQFFMMFFFSWILIGGLAMAFMKVDGKKLDEWLGEKWSFEFSPKTYVLKDEGNSIESEYLVEDHSIPDTLYDFSSESVTGKYGGRKLGEVEVTKE